MRSAPDEGGQHRIGAQITRRQMANKVRSLQTLNPKRKATINYKLKTINYKSEILRGLASDPNISFIIIFKNNSNEI